MRLVVLALLAALTRTAHADEVEDLIAKGEALAKRGEFTSAIAAFKEADAKQPKASHACLIGLVYTRRELWPQAELFFARCRARATDDDPVPKWLDGVERQLDDKLAAAGAAPITIAVEPASAAAKITVSSFAPDEVFDPRTIHLAPGRHLFEVTAEGFAPASREVVVETADPQTITIELHRAGEAEVAPKPAPPPPPAPAPPPPPHSVVPTAVMLGGAALAVAGGAVQLFVYKPARDALASAPDDALYDARVSSFRTRRDLTIGLYAGAAVALATGLVLHYTYAHHDVTVSGAVGGDGAGLTIGWTR